MPFVFIFTPVLLLLIASQIYWILRVRAWGRRRIHGGAARLGLAAIALAAYLSLFAFNFEWLGRSRTPTHMTAAQALLAAPFLWWIFSSMVAFLVVLVLWPVRLAFRRAGPALASPARRRFLEQAARAAIAAPFVAGAYGLLYGRLNLETTEKRIRLARLPRAFQGFRIAQLSDIHVGPFMSEGEIRKYAAIANALKPDLMVLTGDFITWDPSTQQAAVSALAGLRAPFGIFGCLGNHELWSHTEDSITLLFAAAGIRILRQARVPLSAPREQVNLIGIDYATRRRPQPLEALETLVVPDAVNILLSHNPDTFDRAAALGVDLSLAGHTHGGQVALEFISPEIAPSRLVTPYVSGWFEKPGGQLYVNRGIGTIGAPMRIGAPPEITVYELAREA